MAPQRSLREVQERPTEEVRTRKRGLADVVDLGPNHGRSAGRRVWPSNASRLASGVVTPSSMSKVAARFE
jgi:hypothetical protein